MTFAVSSAVESGVAALDRSFVRLASADLAALTCSATSPASALGSVAGGFGGGYFPGFVDGFPPGLARFSRTRVSPSVSAASVVAVGSVEVSPVST